MTSSTPLGWRSAPTLVPAPGRQRSRGDRLDAVQVENQGLQTWEISNRDHVKRLRGAEAGPQLTLPPADLDHFLGLWAESNRQVARDRLHDPSGELFREPRKTAHTTTEQVLDPARLDYYLTLLEVPDERHAAIRRIAEREATRT